MILESKREVIERLSLMTQNLSSKQIKQMQNVSKTNTTDS